MEILDKGSKTVAVLRTRFNTVYRQEGREKWRGGKGKMRIKKKKKERSPPLENEIRVVRDERSICNVILRLLPANGRRHMRRLLNEPHVFPENRIVQTDSL